MLRKTLLVLACLAVPAGGGALAYRLMTPAEVAPLLAWKDKAVVERGRVLYAEQCAGCHGANGEGQASASPGQTGPLAPPHDRNGHTWQHPDFALFQLTKKGVSTVACMTLDESAMPKFDQALTDRQILDVLSYVKSRWPDDIIAQQENTNVMYRDHNAVMWDMLKLDENG